MCDLASPNPFSIENPGRSLERLVPSDLYLPTPDCYVSQEKIKKRFGLVMQWKSCCYKPLR